MDDRALHQYALAVDKLFFEVNGKIAALAAIETVRNPELTNEQKAQVKEMLSSLPTEQRNAASSLLKLMDAARSRSPG